MNLVDVPWLPVRRAASGMQWIRPHELTASLDDDPVVALNWPRADFRFACLEWLIGLLGTACPPADKAGWNEWWQHPPDPKVLLAAFGPLATSFALDATGPRFCQDLEDFAGDQVPIERLLIDAPGENTLKRNTDLLVKRGRVPLLGRPAAAMALYTLQAFAPSGGARHRTSLRGGGPLTTLVIPAAPAGEGRPTTLWHTLWANVPDGRPPEAGQFPLVFPWLAPTRRSEGDAGTVLDSAHADRLQAFWGMPRRIRLDFRAAEPGEICGITGQQDSVVATGFRTRPWGVQYTNAAHFHPLTPTFQAKPGLPPLAVHPQPDGIGYRHWSGLVGPGDKSRPAAAVTSFSERRPRRDQKWPEARLLVGGYDMDNMKARAFIETEMPLFLMEESQLLRFLAFARRMADGATEAAGMLRLQLRVALTISDSDRAVVDSARQRFFELSSPAFWKTLRDIKEPDDAPMIEQHQLLAGQWLSALRLHALGLFDEVAPLDPLSPGAAGRLRGGKWEPPPVVAARNNLRLGLAGHGKAGEALFGKLGLELPPKQQKQGKVRRNG